MPGGDSVIHYEKRSPKIAKCGKCGKSLKGIPRERPYKIRKIGLSKKRTERPYGGFLCSECSRNLIKKKARE